MRQTQEAENVPAHCAVEPPHQTVQKARLLIVEDHDVNQILIQAMTKRLGYETELAADGIEAIAKLNEAASSNNPFDLILMDIQLPILDGYETTRMIRSGGLPPDTLPIIAITANAFRDDVQHCLEAGMQGHIAKPIEIHNLKSVLERWLEPANRHEKRPVSVEGQSQTSDDLIERYRLRKEAAIDNVKDLLEKDTLSRNAIRETSEIMHQLAGIAGIFGDKEFGEHAKLIEDDLEQWQNSERPSDILPALERFLEMA